MLMELTVVERNNDLTFLALAGRLDAMGVQEIDAHFMSLATSPGKLLIVDMSQVSFITSMGIRMLLGSVKILKTENVKMVLLKPQPFVEKALRMVALHELIPILHDEKQARAFVKPV